MVIISGCPSIDPGATAGVIYSPNFPWHYTNGVSCIWNITAPFGKTIQLNFTQFNLSSPGECFDYVEVRDSLYFNRKTFCGSHILPAFSMYGSMTVTFNSSHSMSGSGFLAFYQIESTVPTPTAASTYAVSVHPSSVTPSSYAPHGTCKPEFKNGKLFLLLYIFLKLKVIFATREEVQKKIR